MSESTLKKNTDMKETMEMDGNVTHKTDSLTHKNEASSVDDTTHPVKKKKLSRKERKAAKLSKANKSPAQGGALSFFISIIAMVSGLLLGTATIISVIGKPLNLLPFAQIISALCLPYLSFSLTNILGLFPTSLILIVFAAELLRNRKGHPWSYLRTFLFLVLSGTIYLIVTAGLGEYRPQLVFDFLSSHGIDNAHLMIYGLLSVVIEAFLFILSIVLCDTLDQKYQSKKNRSLKKKTEEKVPLHEKGFVAEKTVENKRGGEDSSSFGVPRPTDVPHLSFLGKKKTNGTSIDEGPTPVTIVGIDQGVFPHEEKASSPAHEKKEEAHVPVDGKGVPKNAGSQLVSLSILQMAKKRIEEEHEAQKNHTPSSSVLRGSHTDTIRHEERAPSSSSFSSMLASAIAQRDEDSSLPHHEVNEQISHRVSPAVRKAMESTPADEEQIKSLSNSLFMGQQKQSSSHGESSHGKEKKKLKGLAAIMKGGHLVEATNRCVDEKSKSSDLPPIKNTATEKAPVKPTQSLNFLGELEKSIASNQGQRKESLAEELLHTEAVPSSTPSLERVKSSHSHEERGMMQESAEKRQETARTAPSAPVTSSQMVGNGVASVVSPDTPDPTVQRSSLYHSTAAGVGEGQLVDEEEPRERKKEVVDDDLKSAIGGLESREGKAFGNFLHPDQHAYKFPPIDLLQIYPELDKEIDPLTREKGKILVETLAQFKYYVTLRNILKGPTVTLFEIVPEPKIKVNAINGLTENIAMNLKAKKVRILAPIPGESAVGVEIPNEKRQVVGFREVLSSIEDSDMAVPMAMGKNLSGERKCFDVAKAPHVLVAGSTGSGKSVCINSLICSILYTRTPQQVRLMMVDPKIVELTVYNGIPHLLTPVISDTKRALQALDFCIEEMNRRNKMLAKMGVRNIKGFNKKLQTKHIAQEQMPYIIVIIDEFANLMSTAGKDLDDRIAQLTAMSRAVGIHLVFATQRPSVDVITGVIKNNLPSRIAFAVTSVQDSRTILGAAGAENLLGKGDMLFSENGKPVSRMQGVFLSDEEVEAIVDFAKSQGEPDYIDEAYFENDDAPSSSMDSTMDSDDETDSLWEEALKIVVDRQGASASFLQRRLKIGYNRAARLVEEMEDQGIVGPPNGSKPRELLRYPDMVNTNNEGSM